MKLLAICIPNYGRLKKLERLVRESARQITEGHMEGQVQICVSDDCSPENPGSMLLSVMQEYPRVELVFGRNGENRGMDRNFLNSVMMSASEYCWIIGNDDMPEENGIMRVVAALQGRGNVDILVTPFDVYGEDGEGRGTVFPLKTDAERAFDTSDRAQYRELVFSIRHNSGLFGFLSNVVFRRGGWVANRGRFRDKMGTIFIQMYMDIQMLQDGAVYLYMPQKVIKNYADDETNGAVDRVCRILFGLDGVVEYFFEGEAREHLKRAVVDPYVSGTAWGLPEGTPYREKLEKLESPRNRLYKRYFIPPWERGRVFGGNGVVIYGAGKYGRLAYQELRKYGAAILGVADSDHAKCGMDFEGLAVMPVEGMAALYRESRAYVVVANYASVEDMVNTLLRNGIEKIAIIT